MISGLNQNSGVAVKFICGLSDVRKDIMWKQRKRDIHSGYDTVVWDGVCGVWEVIEGYIGTHRGLTTSENRLGLKIKHYVIGVGVKEGA